MWISNPRKKADPHKNGLYGKSVHGFFAVPSHGLKSMKRSHARPMLPISATKVWSENFAMLERFVALLIILTYT